MNQKELTDKLAKASELYYKGDGTQMIMSDTEFDMELHKLMDMEKESGIVYPNSPTQYVGSDIQDGFKKGKHARPMLTINNVYDDNDLEAWLDKMEEKGMCGYNISVKYDGISCDLKYVDGFLVQALTRGDKLIGDDITLNVKTIQDVPQFIDNQYLKGKEFHVYGEILLPKSKLNEINEERIANGDKPFANTRNACSGSIKQLDPNVTKKRGLIFRAWDCFFVDKDAYQLNSMTNKALFLFGILGFKYEEGTHPKLVLEKENVVSAVNEFKSNIDGKLDYDYDGIVVKLNIIELQEKLGTTDTRAVEWAIARKWNEEYVSETCLIDVEWQVGRTGVLTPVGRLDPVECGGVMVSNVTLNNAEFVEKYNLHKGNDVTITRSGGVIPQIIDIKHDLLMEMYNAHVKVEIPSVCPICGGRLERVGPNLFCVNEECPAIIKGKMVQFCSKDGMDIRTIGEKVIEDLYYCGIIKSLKDLIKFNASLVGEISMLDGYGDKSAVNMLESVIYARNNVPYEKVLASLSIPGVGKVTARELVKHFPDIDDFAGITDYHVLTDVDGIGETTAMNIYNWIINNRDILWTLKEYGYKTCIEKKEENISSNDSGQSLNLTVCFSGKSSRFVGDEVEAFLESVGCKTVGSVSKKLNYLIIGEKPGPSKVAKAESLGIEIIKEEDFYEKYGL